MFFEKNRIFIFEIKKRITNKNDNVLKTKGVYIFIILWEKKKRITNNNNIVIWEKRNNINFWGENKKRITNKIIMFFGKKIILILVKKINNLFNISEV